MAYIWKFSPEEERVSVREAYRPVREKKTPNSWVAPEHGRVAMAMKRDYLRDHNGKVIEGSNRELVLDKRPNLLVPPRPTKPGFL